MGAYWPNAHSSAAHGKARKLQPGVQRGSCTAPFGPLGSLLHRARSVSRSKRLPGAVPARGRFPGSVDESETGSVNEKAAFRGGLFIGPELRAARSPGAAVGSRPMHLRMPAIDHGIVSFLWGLGLGLYIWIGMLAVGVSAATAFILAAVAGFLIFLYVRIYGEDEPAPG